MESFIGSRSAEVEAHYSKRLQPFDDEFMQVFNSIKREYPNLIDKLIKIESLYNKRSVLADLCYRQGIVDGVSASKALDI